MLKYRLLLVGRRARDPLCLALEGYLERLEHYAKVELIWVRENTLEQERDSLLARLSPEDHVLVLDQRGREVSSTELASEVRAWQQSARVAVAFVVGGAAGLHPDVKAHARELLALSRLTLPHRLAHVVLAEQLYRAHTILRGEPYHR